MKSFVNFVENREQENLASRIVTGLFYQNGLVPLAISQMSSSSLMVAIEGLGIKDLVVTPKLAAQVKNFARTQ